MNYYTIFSVRTRVDSEMKVKLMVDSVIRYTDDDVKKVLYAKSLLDNKLFEVKDSNQAFSIAEAGRFGHELYGLSMRCKANNLTVHKFVAEFELDDDSLDVFVQSCVICEDSREKLNRVKILI